MSAITEDLTQSLIDAARADIVYTNSSMAYYIANTGKESIPYHETPPGAAEMQARDRTKARCVALMDVLFDKADKKVKKEKKVKVETGVYILTYEHDAGMRNRRKTEFYFRDKPKNEDIKDVLLKNGCDPEHKEAWEVRRVACKTAYGFKR